ncbi:hypothetical protein TNCV_3055401 [Trichonephila clavipes]|nr:hypothetical protein TNCV_3055401 [Trichonephila clavipes]
MSPQHTPKPHHCDVIKPQPIGRASVPLQGGSLMILGFEPMILQQLCLPQVRHHSQSVISFTDLIQEQKAHI